ncbi:MAG TPA: hypothetical protein PLB25_11690 [Rhodoferax sp.]|nr:hypothetical protein [Rhodoferax sp.]
MRIKLTNMLSIFADRLGQPTSGFEPFVGHGCSPQANLISQLVWENAWSLTRQAFAYHARNSNIQSHSSRGRESCTFKSVPTVGAGVAPSRRRLFDSGLSGSGHGH